MWQVVLKFELFMVKIHTMSLLKYSTSVASAYAIIEKDEYSAFVAFN